jgi:hypothetical protein
MVLCSFSALAFSFIYVGLSASVCLSLSCTIAVLSIYSLLFRVHRSVLLSLYPSCLFFSFRLVSVWREYHGVGTAIVVAASLLYLLFFV